MWIPLTQFEEGKYRRGKLLQTKDAGANKGRAIGNPSSRDILCLLLAPEREQAGGQRAGGGNMPGKLCLLTYLAQGQPALIRNLKRKPRLFMCFHQQYIEGQEELRVIELVQSNLDYWKWMKLNSTSYRVIYWETKAINIENKIIVNFWTKLPCRYNVLSHQSLNTSCIRKL